VNPTQLNNYGLTLASVQAVLSTQNADIAKGQLSDGYITADIVANDQISKAEDYKPVIIGYHNGTAIRLEDVADVTDSVQNIRSAGYLNGIPSVTVIIFRQPGANIIQTNNNIRSQLPFLQASIPQGIDTTVVLDRTTTIKASVNDVERTLVISVLLVILVVFVFLRNGRATLIPSVAVPVSLIGTFAVMYLLGYSLDNLSLMALTISTGFVVDDAIVVMENISRHLEEGVAPFAAALQGAREIGFTVFSISVSLIAVFIPILMMGGIVGRLFREFAVTLSTAIAVSMVVSLTTTPTMCAHLLKQEKKEEHGRMYQWSEKFFTWMLDTYRRTLLWALDNSVLMLVVLLLTIALNVVLIYKIPKGFFPQQDTGAIVGGVQGPQDSSFPAMDNSIRQLVGVIKSDPAVANVNAYTGGNGATNGGFIYIALNRLTNARSELPISSTGCVPN
jgi:multidrug efflux pump